MNEGVVLVGSSPECPTPPSCRQQCHTHLERNTPLSRNAHHRATPADMNNTMCCFDHTYKNLLVPQYLSTPILVRVEKDVGGSTVEFTIILLGPVGDLDACMGKRELHVVGMHAVF